MNEKNLFNSISEIEHLRLKNNNSTINMLRLSFKHYPEKAKKILIQINKWDKKISILLKEFTTDNHREYDLILDELENLRAQNNKIWMKLYKLATIGSFKDYLELKNESESYAKKIFLLEEELWKHL